MITMTDPNQIVTEFKSEHISDITPDRNLKVMYIDTGTTMWPVTQVVERRWVVLKPQKSIHVWWVKPILVSDVRLPGIHTSVSPSMAFIKFASPVSLNGQNYLGFLIDWTFMKSP